MREIAFLPLKLNKQIDLFAHLAELEVQNICKFSTLTYQKPLCRIFDCPDLGTFPMLVQRYLEILQRYLEIRLVQNARLV